MLNPLEIPNEVISALRSVAAIERLLDDRLRRLEQRFEALDARMAALPDDIEQTLRHHFEGQRGDLASLHDELVANRRQAELLPGKVDGLREEIAEIRETVELLQGPAERAARLSERLPGAG